MERMGSKSTYLKEETPSNEMDVPKIKEIKVTEELTSPVWIKKKGELLNGRFEEATNK